MKLDPIRIAFDKLEPSIVNTAMEYPEGRNILIYCLRRSANRTDTEIVRWLKDEGFNIKDLDKYTIRDVIEDDQD